VAGAKRGRVVVPSSLGIGQSLREARLAQGLTLKAVEASTRIRAHYLQALEDERYDELPGEAYAMGFLRTYADHLGLDGQEYLAAYRARARAAAEPAFLPRAQRPYEPHRTGPALAGVAAAVLLVALSLAAWRLGNTTDSSPPAVELPDAKAVAITAARASQLEVRLGGEDGRRLWSGTLRPGRRLRFGLAQPLWLRARVPRRLRLTAGGTERRLPPRTNVVLVRG
jgi:hypothetical protein